MAAPPVSPLLGIVPGVSSRAAEVQAYYLQFLADDGQSVANGWMTYAAEHPNMDAATAVQAYADLVAAGGLDQALQTGIPAAAGAAGSLANDAGNAAPSLITGVPGGTAVAKGAGALLGAVDAVPKFLSMLTSGNLWLRVGEVIAGLILLGIGVNALFHGKPMGAVTGAAGHVARVVPA